MAENGKGLVAPKRPSISARIQRTDSAIIDDLLNLYGDRVRFNLAPGAIFYGMSDAVREKVRTLLEQPDASSHLSKYGDVLGSRDLRDLWAHIIINGYPDIGEEGADVDVLDNSAKASEPLPHHELMVTAGANQAFVNLVLAISDPGDEVLLILPYYFSHYNAILMTGAVPVSVPVCHDTLLPSIEDIESRITERSRALVVVNPGNPSGVVFAKELMEDIRKLCLRKGIWLILDEAYREFVFAGQCEENKPVNSPSADDGVIKMYTMSKAYGLAGWRVGALVYPKRLSEDLRKAQDTIPTHASRFSERVAFEALQVNPRKRIDGKPSKIDLVNDVRQTFIRYIAPIYETRAVGNFVAPAGAFYLFLPYNNAAFKDEASPETDLVVVKYLATQWDTLVTPGCAFGMCGYIRVSYGSVDPAYATMAAETLANGLRSLFKTQF